MRLERLAQRQVVRLSVLDVVEPDGVAVIRNFPQRMFAAAHPTKPHVGRADSQYAEAFNFLAPGLLGMDGRRRRLPVSLRGGFLDAAASSVFPKWADRRVA